MERSRGCADEILFYPLSLAFDRIHSNRSVHAFGGLLEAHHLLELERRHDDGSEFCGAQGGRNEKPSEFRRNKKPSEFRWQRDMLKPFEPSAKPSQVGVEDHLFNASSG